MDDRTATILRLHKSGATQSQVARTIGVTRQRLHQLSEQLGLQWPAPMSLEERRRQLPGLMRQGLTNDQIAEHLGVSRFTVHMTMRSLPNIEQLRLQRAKARPKRQGVVSAKRLQAIAKRRAAIVPLIERGWSLGRIARHLKVTGQTVRNDLLALGTNRRMEARIHANRVAESRRTRARKCAGTTTRA